MIKAEDIVEIGKFQKTHALKGELNAILDVDEDYAEDAKPFIVDMDGIFVPFYVESIRPKGKESFLVKLKGIDSQEKAQELVNKAVYGLRSDLVDYFDDPEMQLSADFVGFRIIDSESGEIGTVKDIDDTTDNILFIVENADGQQIYIPVADEFIDSIDTEKNIIHTTLPEGLLDLN